MESYALWLTSWYPTTLSPYDGDFIQRHAKAVFLYQKVVVVYVKKDDKGIITKKNKKTISVNSNLTEVVVYYHPKKTGIKFIDRIISFLIYQILYYRTIKEVIREKGVPFLIHAHIIKHIALLCLMLKRKIKKPLIVSEQWTGFLQDNVESFKKENSVYKWLWKKLFKKADQVTVVSKVLGQSLQTLFGIKNFVVVQNVVDTNIFSPSITNKKVDNVFVHISNGFEQKNVPEILQAFNLIKKQGLDFSFHLFVPVQKKLRELIEKLDLKNNIILHGEVPQSKLAETLQESSALILYSQYETFGCVVIEANAVGVPAILSDLEVFREFCIENETCLFAPKNDAIELARVISNFIKWDNNFDNAKIAERTQKLFSFDAVGKQFGSVYRSVL